MALDVSRKRLITTMLVTLMISTTLFLVVMVKITNSSYYLTKYGSELVPVRAFNFENIMKADILRICIIHQYGGVYFDLDTVGVKPLKPFVESTNCSLVPEPPEHTIGKDSVVHVDSIINSALFCKAGHPFYDEILMILEQTNPSCKQPVQCVGPHVLSHVYYEMKRTNSYGSIPRLENYQLFQDVFDQAATTTTTKQCSGHYYLNAEIWRKQMCDEWVRRGKGNRKLSELAFTYHTWYHASVNKVTSGPKNTIKNVVPQAVVFDEIIISQHLNHSLV